MSFAAAVASWPTPNYVNPPSRGDGIVIASAVLGSIATVTTAVRVYTRVSITRTFGSDDVLIILAWMWAIAMMVCLSIASREYGFNRHIWDIPFDKLRTSNVYSLMFELTFSLASSFTKLSLLWFCRRVIGDGRKISCGFHDAAIVVVMILIVTFEIAYLIMLFLQCRPLKALFDIEPKYHYVCNINSHLLTYGASIANTLTDFFTTLIPVTLIGTLHLPYRQRIVIMTIFAIGATVNIAGALRTYYMHTSMLVKNLDRSWVGWPTCISGIVEIGLGVIITALPALRPFIGRFWPTLLESGRRYRFSPKDASPGVSSGSSEPKPRRSRSIFGLSTFDKSWNSDSLITSKITTTEIEMREHSLEQPPDVINVTKTVKQDSLNISPWPQQADSISHANPKNGHTAYDRFNFDFRSEEQSITRLYDSDNDHPRVNV